LVHEHLLEKIDSAWKVTSVPGLLGSDRDRDTNG